jgi:hypothetical protein
MSATRRGHGPSCSSSRPRLTRAAFRYGQRSQTHAAGRHGRGPWLAAWDPRQLTAGVSFAPEIGLLLGGLVGWFAAAKLRRYPAAIRGMKRGPRVAATLSRRKGFDRGPLQTEIPAASAIPLLRVSGGPVRLPAGCGHSAGSQSPRDTGLRPPRHPKPVHPGGQGPPKRSGSRKMHVMPPPVRRSTPPLSRLINHP